MPLNFILQLHRQQFPQMWFPRGTNLFQIFRCPFAECATRGEAADRFMTADFLRTLPGRTRHVARPDLELAGRSHFDERPLPERALVAKEIRDYPSTYMGRDDWWGQAWRHFQRKYGGEDAEFGGVDIWSRIPNVEGIKIQGLPSWLQGVKTPLCSCGRTKEFVFQLASFDRRRSYRELCIGDAGNIYFFACRPCGRASLESRWDCG